MHNRAMDRFDRRVLIVGAAVTLACVALIVLWLLDASSASRSDCQLFDGANVYGNPSVSWLPPGLRCSYNDGAFVEQPSHLRTVVVVVAILGLPFSWWMARALRRRPISEI